MIGDGDVDLIFENGDFNEPAVFTISPAVVSPAADAVLLTVQGIFTDATEQTSPYGNEIEAVLPMFDCSSDALETSGHVVRKGMKVLIRSTNYWIERLQKLGTGATTVHLTTRNG